MSIAYPKAVRIVEVGPRDGLQNEAEIIDTGDKARFISMLADAGLQHIEATSFVHPKWVPQLADAEQLLPLLPNKPGIVFSTLIPNMKGLERALQNHVKRVNVVTAASDTFNQKNINMTVSESLKVCQEVTQAAISQGLTVRAYLSTSFVCPYEGNVAKERVRDLAEALLSFGADEVSLGDTIGAAAPTDVASTVGYVLETLAPQKIALHFHDTYGTALANVVQGLQMGITTFDSSAGGLGGCPYAPGASGNLATEDLVYLLERMNIQTGVDLVKLSQASLFMQQVLGRVLPSKQLKRLAGCLL